MAFAVNVIPMINNRSDDENNNDRLNNVIFFGIHRTLSAYNRQLRAWNTDRHVNRNQIIYTSNRAIYIADVALAIHEIMSANDNDIYVLCGIHGTRDGQNYMRVAGNPTRFNIIRRDQYIYQMIRTPIFNYDDDIRYLNSLDHFRVHIIDIMDMPLNEIMESLHRRNINIILAYCLSTYDIEIKAFLGPINVPNFHFISNYR